MTLRVGDVVRVVIGLAEVLQFHPPGCVCCSATPQGRWELALMLANGVKEPFDIPVGPELQMEHAPVRPTPGEVWVAADGTRLFALTEHDDEDRRLVLVSDAGMTFTPEQALKYLGVLQLALPTPEPPPVAEPPQRYSTDPYVTEPEPEVAPPIAAEMEAELATVHVPVPVARPAAIEPTQILPAVPADGPVVQFRANAGHFVDGAR